MTELERAQFAIRVMKREISRLKAENETLRNQLGEKNAADQQMNREDLEVITIVNTPKPRRWLCFFR